MNDNKLNRKEERKCISLYGEMSGFTPLRWYSNLDKYRTKVLKHRNKAIEHLMDEEEKKHFKEIGLL